LGDLICVIQSEAWNPRAQRSLHYIFSAFDLRFFAALKMTQHSKSGTTRNSPRPGTAKDEPSALKNDYKKSRFYRPSAPRSSLRESKSRAYLRRVRLCGGLVWSHFRQMTVGFGLRFFAALKMTHHSKSGTAEFLHFIIVK
jgi:hypothetical protein